MSIYNLAFIKQKFDPKHYATGDMQIQTLQKQSYKVSIHLFKKNVGLPETYTFHLFQLHVPVQTHVVDPNTFVQCLK